MPTKTKQFMPVGRQAEAQRIQKLRFSGFFGCWKEKKLGEIVEITSSKRIYSSDYVNSGIPFFRDKEISERKNYPFLSSSSSSL